MEILQIGFARLAIIPAGLAQGRKKQNVLVARMIIFILRLKNA